MLTDRVAFVVIDGGGRQRGPHACHCYRPRSAQHGCAAPRSAGNKRGYPWERRCKQAALVYCDLANHLVEGASPVQALAWALDESPVDDDVADVLRAAPRSRPGSLDTSGYVLATLEVAVWALCSALGFEEALVTVVNLGGDADTTGAVAGGLLGAHYGRGAVPSRWAGTIAYGTEVSALAPALSALRLRSPGLA